MNRDEFLQGEAMRCCSVPGCSAKYYSTGLCVQHYRQAWAEVNRPRMSPADVQARRYERAVQNFWRKVNRAADGCWHYLGQYSGGYGRTKFLGKTFAAHRLAYQLSGTEIPEGLVLDHLCRNRACCNPAHLEPVTSRENTLRGETVAAFHASKTHCIRGHEFTPENTRAQGNARVCRACHRLESFAWKSKQREKSERVKP